MARATLLALLLGFSCAHPQRTQRRAELAIGVSLGGVLAGSLAMAALPAQKPTFIVVTIGFGALAIGSAAVYLVATTDTEPAPPPAAPHPPRDSPAWPLTQQAQAAARDGRCDVVRDLDARVRAIDAQFHAAVFARDVAIQRCLATPAESP